MNPADVALLRSLRGASRPVSASELSSSLGLSLATLEERIKELRASGFAIEEQPVLGYLLTGASDRLIGDDLLSRCEPDTGVREVIVFEETDSTNDLAAHLGRIGAEGGVLFVAERQRSGRGRFGRRWASASHLGLWCSLLVRPRLEVAHWPLLTTAAAVGIARGVEQYAGVAVQVKWPNDLLWCGKKLAGILIETGTDNLHNAFAVVGFGINVNHLESDFPEELRNVAASVRIANGRGSLNRPELAAAVLKELGKALQEVEAGRFDSLREEASRRSTLLGKWVQLQSASGTVEGLAEGLDPEGRLEVRTAQGSIVALSGGEVSVLGTSLASGWTPCRNAGKNV